MHLSGDADTIVGGDAKLVIGLGDRSLALHEPIVKRWSVDIDSDLMHYSTISGAYDRVLRCHRNRVTIELDCSQLSFHEVSSPSLREMAKSLPVAELLKIVHEKLTERI